MSEHGNGTGRLPAYFISHGGGPWPWIKDQMPFDMTVLEESLKAMPAEIGTTPKAVLVISGHWETPEFTVQTEYPAPGSPEVAARVTELLTDAGIPVRQDPNRGFDHGVFAPLYVMWPEADVPIVQLSIKRGYDPDEHLAVGRALRPLRDEGVLIVGSGLSFHNLGLIGPAARVPSRQFDEWLTTTLVNDDAAARTEGLRHWAEAPSARIVHPAEDHLIPLMVVVGAAEDDEAVRTYHESDWAGGVSASSYRFGPVPVPA